MLGLGTAYYIWLRLTGLAIPCVFRMITGWKCPGCGITTLILCIAKFDFAGAFQANPFLFVTGPALLLEIGYSFWQRGEKKRTSAVESGSACSVCSSAVHIWNYKEYKIKLDVHLPV